MPLEHSPPLNKSLSMSESDINKMNTTSSEDLGIGHITQRDKKRKRNSGDRSEIEFTDFRAIIREELRDMMSTMLQQYDSRLEIIEKHVAEIKKQNESAHKTNLEIEKSIEFVNSKLDDLQSTINRIETERKQITGQIKNLEEKCDTLERQSRKTCIQVRNVPKQKGENKEKLFDAIKRLSVSLGIESTSLRDVYRMPAKRNQNHAIIVVECSSTFDKERLLIAAKTHKLNAIKHKTEHLNSTHLGIEGPKSEIYLSEHLTPTSSRLFFLAREFRKNMDYAYCWTANGLVYLRKKQGDPYILVRSEAQLLELKNK